MSANDEIFQSCISDIMSNKDFILDIKDETSYTGYIDFIEYKDVNNSLTIGYDKFQRPFFVLRVRIVLSDDTIIDTLETFFQRYSDDRFLWHGCGHDRVIFLHTERGMRIEQILFLKKLIDEKKVDLTKEFMNEISFSLYSSKPEDLELKESVIVKSIELF